MYRIGWDKRPNPIVWKSGRRSLRVRPGGENTAGFFGGAAVQNDRSERERNSSGEALDRRPGNQCFKLDAGLLDSRLKILYNLNLGAQQSDPGLAQLAFRIA